MRVTLGIFLLAALIGCRTNEAPEQQVHDAEIAARVKAKLAQDLGASTVTNISVNATNAVVTLTGTVHSHDEESKAVAIAQAIPKVAKVNDNLQIMATASQ